nr:hypothetical protein [Escherichia fergusonii]
MAAANTDPTRVTADE